LTRTHLYASASVRIVLPPDGLFGSLLDHSTA
jgi:hypothetical protein